MSVAGVAGIHADVERFIRRESQRHGGIELFLRDLLIVDEQSSSAGPLTATKILLPKPLNPLSGRCAV